MNSNRLFKSAFWMTAFVLVVKILGLVKQMIIASVVGATMESDVFFLAGSTINSLANLCFSVISVSALSMYTDKLIHEGEKAANQLISTILKFLIPLAAAGCILFIFFRKEVAFILAPGYAGKQAELLAQYLSLLAPMLILVVYSKTLNVVLQTNQLFIPGEGRAFLQNACVILGVLFLYPRFGMTGVVYCFLLASVLQAVQISFFSRKYFKFDLHPANNWLDMKKIFSLSLPLFCGNAIIQINDLVDKQIGSSLSEGTVSILNYGASINEIVTTLIVSSVSVVLFSQFAKWAARNEKNKVTANLEKTIPVLTFLIAPVLGMCLVAPDLIVSVLFGRGNFGLSEIQAVSGVCMAYACGFLFQSLQAVLVKVFYAFQQTRIPMKAGVISLLANIPLSFLLSKEMGVSGIALATSISGLFTSSYLLIQLKKILPEFSIKSQSQQLFEIMLCLIAAAGITWSFRNGLHPEGLTGFIVTGLVLAGSYLVLACLLKIESFHFFLEKVQQKKRRVEGGELNELSQ